ncbi:MAG: helix-hairpin-helix domain-containing protein [Alishewanella sp.]|uniref:ComEA family DNA-binding protein n=1 Tax=Alishewanella sp. HL-SH06 TaxID=3461144 RepID=UPI002766B312|nr:helix-hairpin-helix domain-containing protein [Alishewanella sp.]MDP5185754.1 helix-hairpin-helix domain-containing protein [Alishewanella sp.]
MKNIIVATLLATAVLVANHSLANSNVQEVTKATASQATTKLRLNQASVEQLVAVPGLGKVKAEAIVAHINENGAISNEADLTKVKGIGPKLAARVAQYVSFD